jgi:hypothetical protein
MYAFSHLQPNDAGGYIVSERKLCKLIRFISFKQVVPPIRRIPFQRNPTGWKGIPLGQVVPVCFR